MNDFDFGPLLFVLVLLSIPATIAVHGLSVIDAKHQASAHCKHEAIILDLASYDKFGTKLEWKDENAKRLCGAIYK